MGEPQRVDPSPTASLPRVLLALAVSTMLALLFGAPGLVHAGNGMPDGPARALTLAAGNRLLQASDAAHLTWPWDRLQSALGRTQQPDSPLLVASTEPLDPPTRPAAGRDSPAVRPLLSAAIPDRIGLRIHPLPRIQAHATVRRRVGCGRCAPRLWVPSHRRPLRLLVTGDSLSGYLGPILVDAVARVAPVQGFLDTHNGTGITTPAFVDWSVVASQQVASDHPDAVVVLLGGNDFQNMTLPGGQFFRAGTTRWRREYGRRAEMVMRAWMSVAKRVYWLSVPPARDPTWAHDDALINLALRRAAARVSGVEYVNVLPAVTNHGRYADFVYQGRQPVLVREPDGVHLNVTGSTLVADEVLRVIRREWGLR